MNYDSMNLGQRIFTARNSKKMKQEALCKLIGVSQSTLSDIENGKTNITVEVLYKISDVLGVPVLWLLSEIEDQSGEKLTQEELFELNLFKEFLIKRRV